MPTSSFPSHAAEGFTLIEQLVTLAVLAIVLALAIPAFSRLLASIRLSAAANELLSSLHLARSEAIRRGERVTLCPAPPDKTDCTGKAWHEGWIMFVDRILSGQTPRLDPGDELLFRGGPSGRSITIQGNGPLASYVSFVPSGLSRQLNGGFLAGTFWLCATGTTAPEPERRRDLVMNAAGRPVLVRPTDGQTRCPSS